VTQLAQAWQKGQLPNNGVKITQQSPTGAPAAYSPCQDYVAGGFDFVSSNYPDSAAWARPMLLILFSPFTCPTDLACAVDNQTVTVTWTNQSAYDSLTLAGLPGGDINIDPATEQLVVENVPCGDYDLTLTAAKGDSSCDLPCSVSVDLLPPAMDDPTVSGDDAILTWTNQGAYDQIVVTVNGVEEPAPLAGDATTYTVADLPAGTHTICLIASDSGCAADTVCKDVTIVMLFNRGDANADGGVDVADATYILMYLFVQGNDPPCMDAADTNDSGNVDLADGVNVLYALFGDGVIPPPNDCGEDPLPEDPLGCDAYDPCMNP
jgi:hypothetical protein